MSTQAKATDTFVQDIEAVKYGFLPRIQSSTQTGRQWTQVRSLTKDLSEKNVWIRGRIDESRCKGKMCFLVIREKTYTVQCVIFASNDAEKEFVKWTGALPLESIVDLYGSVSIPPKPINSATQQVELQVSKVFCVSKSLPELPFQLKDANKPETEESEKAGAITVGQEVRLNNRILDLRTSAMQAVMSISSNVCTLFREYLLSQDFTEIHSPKLIGGSSEGGSNVFKLKYFEKDACLAQSPQLYKQMAISGDLDRVFEIGPVFRAENSNTHRHMCEFTGLDLEMAFKEHYFEVLDIVEAMFRHIFKGLEERCSTEIEVVHKQWPAVPFKWTDNALRLDFVEAVQLLRDNGSADIPEDLSSWDFSTTHEKLLGEIVYKKYNTHFYNVINYPQNVRPFYTMPNPTKKGFSNSYDFFMRGEEIVSGAQRVHEPDFLAERAQACGIDVSTIKDYIDAFRLGAYPHAGVGIGLERVVMLFLGLNNIRKASMFPRDPKRLTP